VGNRASQSVGAAVPSPCQLTVSVLPAAATGGLNRTAGLAAVTVKLLLIARRVEESPANSRRLYVPAASVLESSRNCVSAGNPVVYHHATHWLSGLAAGTMAIQSVGVGLRIHCHATVSVPPDGVVAGLTARAGGSTVNTLLTARRVEPSFANRRSSYVPPARFAGNVCGCVPDAVPPVYHHCNH